MKAVRVAHLIGKIRHHRMQDFLRHASRCRIVEIYPSHFHTDSTPSSSIAVSIRAKTTIGHYTAKKTLVIDKFTDNSLHIRPIRIYDIRRGTPNRSA